MTNNLDINYAVVSAFERSKRMDEKTLSSHAFAVVLMAVFFVALMICLAVGVNVYRQVSDVHTKTNELHLEAGLLVNLAHMNDAIDAVSEGQGPEGRALVLRQNLESGTYEVRIYLYEGNIVQEYAIADRPYNPAGALKVVESSTFDFDINGKLVTLKTDRGSFDVALRSEQGGDVA